MIVVIGGGWAGCAAAVELAQAGHAVELHEAAVALGGRARCVVRDGLPLDNGQHLLLGAYEQTLALASAVRTNGHSPWTIEPLALRPFGRRQKNRLSLSTRFLPAAIALPTALAAAHGVTLRERFALMRWFRRRQREGWRLQRDTSVDELTTQVPQPVREQLFHPLCVAALNTPPARASAKMFLAVLGATLGAGAHATSIVLPREGLGEAVPEAAARWLSARGHLVRRSTRTRIRDLPADGVLLETSGQTNRADAVVVAVGPHQLASTLAPQLSSAHPPIAAALGLVTRFDYEPIATAYLGYDAPLALPRGLLRLDDAPGQWIFDRADVLDRAAASDTRARMRALVAVVISARGPHTSLDHPALARAVDAQLRAITLSLPKLVWSRVIEEKRATYSCVPDLSRPASGRLADRVYLAGDYTCAALPATLEAAVRSGREAARALIADLSQTQRG
ncbi:MAG TPA: hydroxysqualene dehydroxylase HpnE [Casimicrobiaceae bacterium]|nr:hydroxysqualene dehydroxylase HpnE [Casimicrobiaceae bacterium]